MSDKLVQEPFWRTMTGDFFALSVFVLMTYSGGMAEKRCARTAMTGKQGLRRWMQQERKCWQGSGLCYDDVHGRHHASNQGSSRIHRCGPPACCGELSRRGNSLRSVERIELDAHQDARLWINGPLKDLESAIVAELQHFIVEMGSDFAFMGRQKRITIDQRDYYLDLLFYHRRLKCLVAVELKIGEFEAAYKGQMELYLRYLEKHEQVEGENTPIGLILCTGKNHEHVELLQLDKSNIRVADYLTLLPPKELLEAKLHLSIEIARQRLTQSDVSEL